MTEKWRVLFTGKDWRHATLNARTLREAYWLAIIEVRHDDKRKPVIYYDWSAE